YLSREGIHRSVTFADDGVEIRVARLPQPIAVERCRTWKAAAHDDAVAVARFAVAGCAEYIEAFAPALERGQRPRRMLRGISERGSLRALRRRAHAAARCARQRSIAVGDGSGRRRARCAPVRPQRALGERLVLRLVV